MAGRKRRLVFCFTRLLHHAEILSPSVFREMMPSDNWLQNANCLALHKHPWPGNHNKTAEGIDAKLWKLSVFCRRQSAGVEADATKASTVRKGPGEAYG